MNLRRCYRNLNRKNQMLNSQINHNQNNKNLTKNQNTNQKRNSSKQGKGNQFRRFNQILKSNHSITKSHQNRNQNLRKFHHNLHNAQLAQSAILYKILSLGIQLRKSLRLLEIKMKFSLNLPHRQTKLKMNC